MPTKYDNWTATDTIEKSLLDSDIHYLHGDITNENVSEAIKWIVSANLNKKPKRKLTLYINSYGGDLYEAFALIDVMKNSYHTIATVGMLYSSLSSARAPFGVFPFFNSFMGQLPSFLFAAFPAYDFQPYNGKLPGHMGLSGGKNRIYEHGNIGCGYRRRADRTRWSQERIHEPDPRSTPAGFERSLGS